MTHPLEYLQRYNVILGSGSPRRSELLSGMGLSYEVRVSDIDETVPDDIPLATHPIYLSEAKSHALAPGLQKDDILITADTIVLMGSQILNKPRDVQDALRMLQLISGREHMVISAITVRTTLGYRSLSDMAKVSIAPLSGDEMAYYIDTYQPMDKAGAYGIQEWFGLTMIQSIQGSYYTIMGMPTHRLYHLLKNEIHEIL